jgi:AraC-like DNA-binding protein
MEHAGSSREMKPQWPSMRLQEVARVLSSRDIVDVATLAAELGYADQAHLVNDFRDAAGVTPGEYVRALRSLGDTRTED